VNPIIWILAIATLVLDQASKFVVLSNLAPGASTAVIKDFFHLTLVYNTGAAFGIFKNQTLFFVISSFAAVILIFIYLKRKRGFLLVDAGFALILGGAMGNLVDRLRFGYVVDFLDFRIWPVFNVADSAITVGAGLVIISLCTRFYSR
jgi:signal peptidase II